jgi:hypothetical protein
MKDECLNKCISFNECSVLNVEDADTLKEVLSSNSTLKSNEDDPQILITLKFVQNVNITYIQVEGGMNSECQPSTLKVFNGRNDLDFDDVQEMKPTEQFDLLKNKGKPMKVNIPRFRNVNMMTVRYFYLFLIFIYIVIFL